MEDSLFCSEVLKKVKVQRIDRLKQEVEEACKQEAETLTPRSTPLKPIVIVLSIVQQTFSYAVHWAVDQKKEFDLLYVVVILAFSN